MVLTFLSLSYSLNRMVLTRNKLVYYIARFWVFILAVQEKKEEGDRRMRRRKRNRMKRRRAYPILVANDKTEVFL